MITTKEAKVFNMNWEVITWTFITIGFLICITGIIITLISFRNISKRNNDLTNVHTKLDVGSKILFCNGIFGTVKKINEEKIDVEIAKGTVITISRYSINNIFPS